MNIFLFLSYYEKGRLIVSFVMGQDAGERAGEKWGGERGPGNAVAFWSQGTGTASGEAAFYESCCEFSGKS